jgi:hypothetical protein
VLHGWAGASLLETYEVERRPVAERITHQSLLNLAVVEGRPAPESTAPGDGEHSAPIAPKAGVQQVVSEWGLIFGAAYASAAVAPDATNPPDAIDDVTDYVPTARPGHRAPHVWLQRHGQHLSTLDLFDARFVLLTAQSGSAWQTASLAVDVPLACYQVGPGEEIDDPNRSWCELYGIDETGAVLVRPDGHVAWRARTGVRDPAAELSNVLAQVLGHGPASRARRVLPPRLHPVYIT